MSNSKSSNSTENRFEMVMHQKCIRDSDLELGI